MGIYQVSLGKKEDREAWAEGITTWRRGKPHHVAIQFFFQACILHIYLSEALEAFVLNGGCQRKR